ncbi:KATNB1 family protein [Megaselia abdita]
MALTRKLTSKIYDIKAHEDKVKCLDLGETGRVLVTGGVDRNVNLWAIGNDKCSMSLTGHNGKIECVKFAYTDDFVYSADDIGIIRRWDLNSQTISSTFNGHMQSVRTLDFNPSGEYVASGGNDTTVRLWDVRNYNSCIKTYRGHIANVNSVRFSPDGLWIASAGTEGSIIIWDIRRSKQIIEFKERSASITCIQFHPYEFLLAAGRGDGSVYIYDLENKVVISKTEPTKHPVKCLIFSDQGECLFVGSSGGISVVGWEPDRQFDHIESAWTFLGDMKIVNRKLICGSYDDETATIHALSVDRVVPFYNPSSISTTQTSPFSYNQTTRKSFTRGNQKLRLSINNSPKPTSVMEELEDQSSPNLSIELVDVEIEDPLTHHQNQLQFETITSMKKNSPPQTFTSLSSMSSSSGPSSLKLPGERFSNRMALGDEFMLNDSNPPIISNYEDTEIEDFPVNNAQPPDYAPKTNNQKTAAVKHKATVTTKRQQPQLTKVGNRLTKMNSISTQDLTQLNEATSTSNVTTAVRKYGNGRIRRESHTNKENVKNKQGKDITVTFVTKPPPPVSRAKTSFDLKTANQIRQQNINNRPVQRQGLQNAITQRERETTNQTTTTTINTNANVNYNGVMANGTNFNRTVIHNPPSIRSDLYTTLKPHNEDQAEINMLVTYHEQIYTELANRHAMLVLIRNSTKTQDIVGALKEAIKLNAKAVFVDILGAVLEKTWVLLI